MTGTPLVPNNVNSLLCFPEPLLPCTDSFQTIPLPAWALALVQNSLLGRNAPLTCGSVCVCAKSSCWLSLFAVAPQNLPPPQGQVCPHQPRPTLLASACCAKLHRALCPVTDRAPCPVTELRRIPAISICVMLSLGHTPWLSCSH